IGPGGPGPASLDVVRMAWCPVVTHRRHRRSPRTRDACNSEDLHVALDLVAAPVVPGSAGGLPQFAAPVEAVGLAPQVVDLVRSERVVELGLGGAEAAGGVGPVRARGDL